MCQSHVEAWETTNMAANLAIQDHIHPDDQTLQPTIEMTPGFKPFTLRILLMLTFNVILGYLVVLFRDIL